MKRFIARACCSSLREVLWVYSIVLQEFDLLETCFARFSRKGQHFIRDLEAVGLAGGATSALGTSRYAHRFKLISACAKKEPALQIESQVHK